MLDGLYNVRNDKRLPYSTLNNSTELSTEAVETVEIELTESEDFQQTQTDRLTQKLSNLEISVEFSLNLLTDLSQLTGSGSYLS